MAPTSQPNGRFAALDGLRGVAALIVVLYHYLCLLHPSLTPPMTAEVHWIVDTPAHILWNGRFAVAVFFVLSGFVMAAAADRRRNTLIASAIARYFRLALPATASCLLSWCWLTAFPDSAEALKGTLSRPSRWLDFTYQSPIPPVWRSVVDGMAAAFARGGSSFNNALWTMRVELVGSLVIFLIYALTQGITRVLSLAAAGAALVFFSAAGIGFVFGAVLYEVHRRDMFRFVPALAAIVALAVAVALGGPGDGAHLRLGLLSVPEQWQLGRPQGVVTGVAAALMIYAILTLPALARLFTGATALFLGRISFGIYLVHVPPLYTIVAWAYLSGVPEILLAPIYALGVLALAWIFTLAVDEPSLRWVAVLRTKIWPDRLLWLVGRRYRRAPVD
jgi:peptidoglycan/LPS O-acetylase OafA/YrhL